MSRKKIAIIGSGFSSLASACFLAQDRFDVTVYEKNSTLGGRARVFKEAGFTFDMGPSWYWMPDVFESFFNKFNKKVSDYYNLVRLDPSYKVVFSKDEYLDLPANLEMLKKEFEKLEMGSGARLEDFLKQAQYKYQVGMNDLVYKPGLSIKEFSKASLLFDMTRMDIFQSFSQHARKFFTNEQILKIIEFPVLFLGATPENTPALYSLMNYADISLGTWYPMGGMFKIVDAMVELAKELGVKFHTDTEILKIEIENKKAKKIITNKGEYVFDILVGGADYNHIEQKLIEPKYRNYDNKYWDSRTMSPSSLIFYLGVDRKINNLLHHNLFFDSPFSTHAKEIYDNPVWPSDPLFYVSAPSKTDLSVAPEGMENLFILIPVAPDLNDNDQIREKYYDMVMKRLEAFVGHNIKEHIIYKRSYAHKDFKSDYYAYKGNAYGLANTLKQTAILKPSIKNKNVENIFYTGQLTTPGPGVPPSLISGEVVAEHIKNIYH